MCQLMQPYWERLEPFILPLAHFAPSCWCHTLRESLVLIDVFQLLVASAGFIARESQAPKPGRLHWGRRLRGLEGGITHIAVRCRRNARAVRVFAGVMKERLLEQRRPRH